MSVPDTVRLELQVKHLRAAHDVLGRLVLEQNAVLVVLRDALTQSAEPSTQVTELLALIATVLKGGE